MQLEAGEPLVASAEIKSLPRPRSSELSAASSPTGPCSDATVQVLQLKWSVSQSRETLSLPFFPRSGSEKEWHRWWLGRLQLLHADAAAAHQAKRHCEERATSEGERRSGAGPPEVITYWRPRPGTPLPSVVAVHDWALQDRGSHPDSWDHYQVYRFQLSGPAVVHFRLINHARGNVAFHSTINRLVERPNSSEVLCLREIEPIMMLYATTSAWIRRTQTSALMQQPMVRSREKASLSFDFSCRHGHCG